MVFRKEIQMFGFLFVFMFSVGTDGVQRLSATSTEANDGSLLPCNFPAVFNFGDSNSDTGGMSAALYPVPDPNGETFFGKPSGRACDGRLIVDFMAQEVGIPFLRPYLDSLALTSFKNGANFATGGSSIRKPGYSPFHLEIQISQFRQFKARIIDIVNSSQGKEADLPKPEDFSKALYTFDIGQNDLSYGLQTSERETRAAIPNILDLFSTAVQQLYSEGARVFWVHNTGPIGCLPSTSKYYTKPGDLDKNGCVTRLNVIAQDFNSQLKSRITQLKANLTGAAFTYVDAYTAKSNLIKSAKSQGFVDPWDYCGPCANPKEHISWDGTHYSEAANQWIANFILNGSMSDSSIPINQACHA